MHDLLETIFNSISDPIIVYDHNGRLLEVNPATCNHLGYSRDELLQMNVLDIISPELREKLSPEIAEISDQKSCLVESACKCKDGCLLPVELNVIPTTLHRDQVKVAVVRDITKRKNAEMILRKNEGHLRALIDTIPDLVWQKDVNGVILSCNAKFESFAGLKEEEIIGKTDYDFNDKELADFFKQKDIEAMEAGRPLVNEEIVTYSAGHEEYLETRKCPMYDPDGKLIGIVGVGRDITERKHNEEKLRESEALLNEVGILARVGGWDFDVATGAVKWTAEVYKIFDLEPDFELAYGNTLKFYSSDSRETVEKAFNGAIERFESYDLELELITPKGNHKWVRTIGRPTIENGKVVKVTGSFQDITERKNAEKKLSESEETLSLFIEHSPAALVMLDRDMRHIAVSRRWADMISLSPEDIIGKCHYDILPDLPEFYKDAHRRALQGETVRRDDDRAEMPDGSIHWSSWEVRPWKTSDGAIGGIIIFSEDVTERKEAEIALKENEALLTEVGTIAKVGGWEYDVASGTGKLTPEVYRIYDLGPYSSTGVEYTLSFYLPASRKLIEKAFNDAVKKGEPYDLELELITPKGNHKWVRTSGRPTMENGKVVKINGSFQDITERKKVDEKLRESESRIRRKLNAIMEPEGDIGELELADIIDKDSLESLISNFYQLTNIAVAILDLKGEVLIGEGWQDICMKFHRVNPESCKHCLESDVELSRGVALGTYKTYKCKNNMWYMVTPIVVGGTHLGNLFIGQFFLEDEVIPYDTFRLQAKKYGFDEKEYLEALDRVPRWSQKTIKQTMEFYTLLTNVLTSLSYSNIKLARILNERDELLTSLHDSESKFRTYVQSAPYGIFIIDGDRNYLEVNKTACDLIGYGKDELTHMSIDDVIAPDSLLKAWQSLDELKTTGYTSTELQIRHKDGSVSWIRRDGAKLSDDRFILFASDITEKKKAEHSLIEAKMLAEHNNRIKSEFLANVSHELRTPLTSVIGFSDILQEGIAGELTDKQLGYVDNINKSGNHLLEIINDILDLSRVEAGKMDMECEDFYISELIDETLVSMSPISDKKNIELKSISNINDVNIHADKVKIRQILYNLLNNAIKFTPENGEIFVRIERIDNEIQVSVIDTGVGIPAEMQEEIFSPFTQADASHTRRYGGTGLGLALVKKFVEMHNGRVWLESEVGKGSTFTFTMPITP